MLLWACLSGLPNESFAQYDDERDATIPLDHFYIKRRGPSGLRVLLSKVHFGLSTGYGQTFLHHKLDGYGIFQKPDSMPKIFNANQVSAGYSNWFNTVRPSTNTAEPSTFLVNSDTAELGFKSRSINIPLKATVHVEFDRYRIGGGYSIEYMKIGDFKPISYASDINSFAPEDPSFFLKKYFLLLGGTVYRYYNYALVVDANIGGYKLGRSFDKSLIKRGVYVNVGVTIEKHMSEYFRLFVRPSFEFKGYKLTIPESGSTLSHRMNAAYVNVGMTYRIPELRRCVIKNCQAQITHAHGNREYRSRMHPIYKKQNPHYGENYPVLIKYKGKNRKKLNPY